ncbi:hypothetical protein, partial [Sphingomonas ginsenosidimutans]|uniref:hypothetical protein n=1 Tax=Sphingomonas ginsenosidimutans TaxID=862134 RepID=UPI001D956F06
MTDRSGFERSAPRPRFGPVLTIAIIGLLIGLGLMAYAVRNTPGFFRTSASTPAAVASGATPAPAAVSPRLTCWRACLRLSSRSCLPTITSIPATQSRR